MAKKGSEWVCESCEYVAPRWMGRCPSCDTYGSFKERTADAAPSGKKAISERRAPAAVFVSIDQVGSGQTLERLSSGLPELDRVLGGGFVPGFYGLIAGEPGAGKSTVTNQLAVAMTQQGRKVAIISGEESAEQIRIRLNRLTDSKVPAIAVSSEVSAERIYSALAGGEYDLAIIDSINSGFSEEASGEPGGPQQMRACASIFQRIAKEQGTAIFLVGQVTKDNVVAGPRMLEHTVDAFLMFEGDRSEQYRILRAMKNRFGATDEIGIFEMTGRGLVTVIDPSALFISAREVSIPGAVTTVVIEGSRPVLCEVQALVTPSNLPQPIRASRGLDPKRTQMLLAVLGRRGGCRGLSKDDVYLNIAGGLRVDEPAIDLAVCVAVASAQSGRPVKKKYCVIGEVSLLGEARHAPQFERRAGEAKRQGFEAPSFKGSLADAVESCLDSPATEPPVEAEEG